MTNELKRTALTHVHETLGAKMVPFAGYLMPVQYTGVNDEHLVVRNAVGVFDVSHMGEFIVRGPGALDLIQKVTSNDASKLAVGKVQYSCLPNATGGIVDDLLVYRMQNGDDQHYVLVVNASNIDKDWAWINSLNTFDAQLENISDHMSLLAVQGPKATATLQPLFSVDLGAMEYYTAQYAEMKGVGLVLISSTGYTGAGGYEVYMPNPLAQKAWDAIFASGAAHGIKPAGLACRDTLRLEMGFPLYGHEMDDQTSGYEARVGWAIKPKKAGGFIGGEALLRLQAAGLPKKLVGLELLDRGVPRADYPVLHDGVAVGKVTSGTHSPTAKKPIALAFVPPHLSALGTELAIDVRGQAKRAVVVAFPFVTPGSSFPQ